MFQNPHLKSRFFVIYQWDIAHKPPKFDGLCIITRAEILRNVTFLHFCKTPVEEHMRIYNILKIPLECAKEHIRI